MKVLITGGAGFIGSKLARRLTGEGHEVTVVDSLHAQIHGDIPTPTLIDGITYIRADIRDLERAEEAIEAADAIYHLAAETGTGQSMYKIEEYVGVNEMGTAHLLQVLGRGSRRNRRIILASSRSVYGEGAYRRVDGTGGLVQPAARSFDAMSEGRWGFQDEHGAELTPVATPESLPFYPGSIYAATKASQELLLLSGSESVGAKTTILRLQNVYGEGQSLRNPYTGIISIFFNQARQGLGINLYEDGTPSRDFVHIDDVVGAFARALEADLPHGTVSNVGSGVATSISQLAEELLDIAGFDVPVEISGKFRVGDIRHNWADLDVARAQMGFVPQVSLREGLGRFVAWAKTEPAYEDLSKKAEAELKEKGLAK